MTDKKHMIIDGNIVNYDDEKNILAVIRKAGIELPTFCYYSELSIYGACRMCVVEDEWGGVVASCSTPPRNKMKIKTNTPQLQKHRKMILELLLASHCRDCTTCPKNGKCRLQELAVRFGITDVRFNNTKEEMAVDESALSIIRDPSKCILCGDCVRMCSEIQNVGAIDFAYRGSKMQVMPAFNKPLKETNCVNCGQCAAVCPTGAIVIRNCTQKFWDAINDEKKRVIVQFAPAVRVALGDEFGLESGTNVAGKIVGALRKMGVDEVYDTTMGADLTVMEESKEFVKKFKEGKELPLFTSCCPAWVKYAENTHPDFVKNLSTTKSPMQIFSAVIKEHFKQVAEVDGKETLVFAIMPCTAKKDEQVRDEFMYEDGGRDTDGVITTQEFASMIKQSGIVFEDIDPEATDMPFGITSGAGVIFGVTGGVAEAVIRRVIDDKSIHMLHNIAFTGVRGMEGIKEASIPLGDKRVRIAVVNGLANAEKLIQRIKNGEAEYDLIEVMACPGGCIAGAGQPFTLERGKQERADGLYAADKLSQIKRSEENPAMMGLYGGILQNKIHELLHVDYNKKGEK
ncbi:MAG: [FeFe] hydrogenase, group A [Christensenellaceae bacterium]